MKVFLLLLWLPASMALAACDLSDRLTRQGEVIYDRLNHLEWQACSLGCQWQEGKGCVGTPALLTLLMYASPVIYPLTVVQEKLLTKQTAGEWSSTLYTLYTLNPLAGIVDAFQRVLLKGLPPDPGAMWPGMVLTVLAFPICYAISWLVCANPLILLPEN